MERTELLNYREQSGPITQDKGDQKSRKHAKNAELERCAVMGDCLVSCEPLNVKQKDTD